MSPSTQPPTSDPTPEPSPTPSPSSGNPVDQAKADLSGRLGVSAEEVKLVSANEVTWRDSSLGCPQPGMHYAQVLTNGTQIILTAGGKQYHYHSSAKRPPFLCESPQPPLSTGG